MLNLLRWIAVSFSLYSRIPMPRFAWNEDDMRHSMLFFPLVGIVIGGITLALYSVPIFDELPLLVRCAVTILVPVLVTGGFHLDGFMDTEDALRSWQPREKKLEILKDPHIGAFAVIGLVSYFLIAAASIGVILTFGSRRILFVSAAIFAVSRALGGISALLLPKAKKDGMLAQETAGKKGAILAVLFVWLAAGLAVMMTADIVGGALVAACFILCLIRYRRVVVREFGGVTGDTTGYFITVSETAAFAVLAAAAWAPWK